MPHWGLLRVLDLTDLTVTTVSAEQGSSTRLTTRVSCSYSAVAVTSTVVVVVSVDLVFALVLVWGWQHTLTDLDSMGMATHTSVCGDGNTDFVL